MIHNEFKLTAGDFCVYRAINGFALTLDNKLLNIYKKSAEIETKKIIERIFKKVDRK